MPPLALALPICVTVPFPVPDAGAADVVAAHAVLVLAVLVGTPHSVPLMIVAISVAVSSP